MNNLHGQGYDCASNMSGHIGGLQALVKQEHPYAHYVHCYAHKLSLAVDGAVAGVRVLFEYIETVRHARNLVTGSAKRHSILEEALGGLEDMAVADAKKYNPSPSDKGDDVEQNTHKVQKKSAFPEPSATRCWSGNQKLVNAMYDNVTVVHKCLTELMDDEGTSHTQATEMNGVLTRILNFSFFFCTTVMQRVFKRLDILSRHLQTASLDLEVAHSSALNKIKTFEEWKDQFEDYWEKTKVIVEEKNRTLLADDQIKIPTDNEIHSGRRGQRSQNAGRVGVPGSDVPPAKEYTIKQQLKDSVYLPVYEAVISKMKSRFDGESMKELLIGLNSLSPLNDFEKFNVRNIISFAEQYSSHFNLDGIFGRQNLEHELKARMALVDG